MRIPNRPPVVVGVNGTAAGLAAVRLAAREAASRDTPLSVVHAFTWDEADARRAASRFVDEAVATAQRSTPGVDVRGQLVDGPAGSVLRRFSRTAAILVLGAGDKGAGDGDGSALLEVATRAWCPVLVAHGPRVPSGRAVAAVDGSGPSVLALRFAAGEARRRGLPLDVAHVAADGAEEAGRRMLDEVLAAVPDLPPVRRRLLSGPVATTLVRVSRRAGLIAIGPRGNGGAARFGSVAYDLLRHSGCATVFVHARREPAGKSKPGHSSSRALLR